MVDLRTLAAAVLGVALGLFFVASPETVVRIQTAGRVPQDRRGRYGEDRASGEGSAGGTADAIPTRWRRLVQALGVVFLLGGLYFGWTLA